MAHITPPHSQTNKTRTTHNALRTRRRRQAEEADHDSRPPGAGDRPRQPAAAAAGRGQPAGAAAGARAAGRRGDRRGRRGCGVCQRAGALISRELLVCVVCAVRYCGRPGGATAGAGVGSWRGTARSTHTQHTNLHKQVRTTRSRVRALTGRAGNILKSFPGEVSEKGGRCCVAAPAGTKIAGGVMLGSSPGGGMVYIEPPQVRGVCFVCCVFAHRHMRACNATAITAKSVPALKI